MMAKPKRLDHASDGMRSPVRAVPLAGSDATSYNGDACEERKRHGSFLRGQSESLRGVVVALTTWVGLTTSLTEVQRAFITPGMSLYMAARQQPGLEPTDNGWVPVELRIGSHT
jgi:hypothetical protein